MDDEVKPVYWVGSSLDDLKTCPENIMDQIGFAVHLAQIGDKHPHAKPLKGFSGVGVLEVVAQDDGNTYRAMYTVKFKDAIYVLHVFQKKSRKGIETPKEHMDLVKSRLRMAQDHYIGG